MIELKKEGLGFYISLGGLSFHFFDARISERLNLIVFYDVERRAVGSLKGNQYEDARNLLIDSGVSLL